jgi:thiol-disulfide isomerase/thioredoxin
MKRLIIVLLALILIGISIYTVNTYNTSIANNKVSQENTANSSSIQSNSNKSANAPIRINPNVIKTKALDFKLKDLDGKELSLSDLKGKKVFLNFWATWCPSCKAEMPEIEKLYQETKNSDLVIVSVDIGESLSIVKSFVDSNKYNFKVLLDSDESIATKYSISAIPTSYFIDADGYIISKNVGAMDIDQMKAYIKNLDK